MPNSRNKGAQFERKIASELYQLLGITFTRDLEQYRKCDRGDLIPDDPAFPFLIECKKTARVLTACDPAWWDQAHRAALAAGTRPAVIWASDRRDVRVTVTLKDAMECISRGKWSGETHLIELPLEGFAYLCREGMA